MAEERAKALLRVLLQSDDAQTAENLAQHLQVSEKTVRRDLPFVEALLTPLHLSLERKKGMGFWVQGESETKKHLLDTLQHEKKMPLTPESRRSRLLGELLPAKEPVKLFALARALGVTDSTISNDLDKLELWFLSFNLHLVRRPGFGVYVEGSEEARRRAMVSYFYEELGEEDILSLARGRFLEAGRNVLPGLFDPQRLRQLETFVRAMEIRLGKKLSDDALSGLVVHLAIALERMQAGERIEMDTKFLQSLQQTREFRVAANIAKRLETQFALQVPTSEIGYITMHLLGARNRVGGEEGEMTVMQSFELVRLARNIVKTAAEETGKPLEKDARLLSGLVNHLGPAVRRLRMRLEIRNPLLSEMEGKYPRLMEIADHATKSLAQAVGGRLPRGEIAYIAMHLGASIEGAAEAPREIRAIVACPAGMGTSKILSMRLREEYIGVRVLREVSAFDLEKEGATRADADIVISMIPIEGLSLPVVVVTPMLTEKDKAKIDKAMAKLPRHLQGKDAAPARNFKDELRSLRHAADAVQSILDGFFCIKGTYLPDDQLMEEGARHFAPGKATQKIAAAMEKREHLASTYLPNERVHLFHALDGTAGSARMGAIAYDTESGPMAAIFLLADPVAGKEAQEAISAISAGVVERPGFLAVLLQGDRKAAYEEVSRILQGFLQTHYKAAMEVPI